MYTDDSIMPNGKYKAWRLKDIPVKYFTTIWDNGGGGNPLLGEYIKNNLDRFRLTGKYSLEPPSAPITFSCKKRTYATKKIALENIIKPKSKQIKKAPIRAYECKKCSGWHLTSKEYDEYVEEKEARSKQKLPG